MKKDVMRCVLPWGMSSCSSWWYDNGIRWTDPLVYSNVQPSLRLVNQWSSGRLASEQLVLSTCQHSTSMMDMMLSNKRTKCTRTNRPIVRGPQCLASTVHRPCVRCSYWLDDGQKWSPVMGIYNLLSLQPRLNWCVLTIEIAHIRH